MSKIILSTFKAHQIESKDSENSFDDSLSFAMATQELVKSLIKEGTLFHRKIEKSDGNTIHEFVFSVNDLSLIKKKNPELF